MKKKKINLDRLLDNYVNLLAQFENRPEFNGYGLIGHENRSEKVDRIFDEVCQEMKLPLEICFEFANSRPGRHAGDDLDERKTPAAIKKVFEWYIHSELTYKEDPWLTKICPDWTYKPTKVPKPIVR